MFYEDLTPLIGDPDQIRAGRIYPGGADLDRLVGSKKSAEPGWYYPEAWIFSPVPAINQGSLRIDDGMTIIYDKRGNKYRWEEFIGKHGRAVLGECKLRITVKLLDGACTLPKEFHFKPEDEYALRKYPLLEDFRGTLIKPEVWIRHPADTPEPSYSYIGFKEKLNPAGLKELLKLGVENLEASMNRVSIEPGSGAYIPGGVVHSLGKGLYFEILADGDLKVTLQKEFAGRRLTEVERLDKLFRGRSDDMDSALGFVEFEKFGSSLLAECMHPPAALDAHRSSIVKNPYFSADWIRLHPGEEYGVSDNGVPHILAAARGRAALGSAHDAMILGTGESTFGSFKETGCCLAALVHAGTRTYHISNPFDQEALVLAAYGSRRPA